MKITEVLKRVDEVYPNNYTEEEKFRWCDEVSAEVMQEVKKQYVQVGCRVFEDDFIELPQNVTIEQVKYVFIDGRRIDKTEFMRRFHVCPYGICGKNRIPPQSREVSMVFLPEPRPVRRFEFEAECELKPISDEDICDDKYESGFPKTNEGIFTIVCPDIMIGDTLIVTPPNSELSEEYYVLGYDFGGVRVACDNEIEESDGVFTFSRKITDRTEVPSPYNKMYIEYLLAQITYYQHDYDEYNIHLGNYMSIFDAYVKWYKSRAPIDPCARLRNFW